MSRSIVINRIVIILGNKRHIDMGGLLGILGRGVPPPGSQNPGSISDHKKCHFPDPFSVLEVVKKHNMCHVFANRSYVIIDKTKTATNRFLKSHLESTYYTFFFFGIEKTNTLIHSRS